MAVVIILFYLFVFAIGILGTIFWVWMIVDCATNEPAEDKDRTLWILVVILAGLIGAAIYYFVRRPERMQKYGK